MGYVHQEKFREKQLFYEASITWSEEHKDAFMLLHTERNVLPENINHTRITPPLLLQTNLLYWK